MTGRAAVALAALLLGLAAVTAAWLAVDRRPPEFLSRQRGLSGLAATVEPCRVAVRWSLPGPDLRARLGLTAGPAPAPFTLRVDGVRYGGLRVPGLLVGWIVRNFDPTPRLRRLPMTVSVAPISIGAGRLEIGREPDPSCLTKESR
jgi:hypothetical protein